MSATVELPSIVKSLRNSDRYIIRRADGSDVMVHPSCPITRQFLDPEEAQRIADRIPGARVVPLDKE